MKELDDVKGIGPATLKQLLPYVSVAESSATMAAAGPVPGKDAPATPLARVRINSGTRDELMELKGVGPALADRIIEDRLRRGPFNRTIPFLGRTGG